LSKKERKEVFNLPNYLQLSPNLSLAIFPYSSRDELFLYLYKLSTMVSTVITNALYQAKSPTLSTDHNT
jgi:hypothetical protein